MINQKDNSLWIHKPGTHWRHRPYIATRMHPSQTNSCHFSICSGTVPFQKWVNSQTPIAERFAMDSPERSISDKTWDWGKINKLSEKKDKCIMVLSSQLTQCGVPYLACWATGRRSVTPLHLEHYSTRCPALLLFSQMIYEGWQQRQDRLV